MNKITEYGKRFMGQSLVCSICGKLAEEDSHFYPKKMLCNRHYIQISRHGKITYIEEAQIRIEDQDKKCYICEDKQSPFYRMWKENGEYKNKILCSKHYKMLKTKGFIYDPMANTYIKKEDRICDKCFSTKG